jgi:prepilin-type N-terminal cleavage/methylation domain-containing protein
MNKIQEKTIRPAGLPLKAPVSPVKSRLAHSPGFTLLELILAMFITCLLAVALYGSLWTAFKARDTAIGAVEPAREMQVTMEMIGRDLQAAVPMSQTNSTGQMALIGPFEGEAQGTTSQLSETVEFYAITNGIDSNDPTQADGMRRIDLEMTTLDDGTQALVENITPALPGDQQLLGSQQPTQAQAVSRVLSRNVASFSAQYSDGQNWYDVWDATAYSDSLPMSVQITIQMKPPANAAGRNGMSMTRIFALPTAISINSSSTSS